MGRKLSKKQRARNANALPFRMLVGTAAKGTAQDWQDHKDRKLGSFGAAGPCVVITSEGRDVALPDREPVTTSKTVLAMDAAIMAALRAKVAGKPIAITLEAEVHKSCGSASVTHIIDRLKLMERSGKVQRLTFQGDGAVRIWKTKQPGLIFVRLITLD